MFRPYTCHFQTVFAVLFTMVVSTGFTVCIFQLDYDGLATSALGITFVSIFVLVNIQMLVMITVVRVSMCFRCCYNCCHFE